MQKTHKHAHTYKETHMVAQIIRASGLDNANYEKTWIAAIVAGDTKVVVVGQLLEKGGATARFALSWRPEPSRTTRRRSSLSLSMISITIPTSWMPGRYCRPPCCSALFLCRRKL